MRISKWFTHLSLMAAISLAISACTPGVVVASQPTATAVNAPASTSSATTAAGTPTTAASTTSKTTTQAKNSNTIVEVTISQPSSLDPAWEYDTASQDVVINVYETLNS